METNEMTKEKSPQAQCPKCGEQSAANFKFCPFCGHAMTADAPAPPAPVPSALSEEAPPSPAAQGNKTISPEALKAMEEFDRRLEEMKRIRESKPVKLKSSSLADNKIMVVVLFAAMLIFLILIGFFMSNFAKIVQK